MAGVAARALEAGDIGLPADQWVGKVRGVFQVETLGEKLSVRGTLEGVAELECVRCLRRYELPLRVPFQVFAERSGHATRSDEAELERDYDLVFFNGLGHNGIYIGGVEPNNGGQLQKDKVAILGDNEQVKVIASDGFVTSAWFDDAGAENVNGAYGTAPTRPADQLTAEGQEFLEGFREVIGDEPVEFSIMPGALKVLVGPDYVPEPEG